MADRFPDLDGPRLAPLSGRPARQLVVLIHGYGSNGADLISLAPLWQQALPDAAFVAPNAPQRCPWGPGAYQWWALGDLSPAGLAAGALAAGPVLDRFLDDELARTGLSEDRLVLAGFSQGTMMALHVAPRRVRMVAGVVGYSGLLADAGALAGELRTRPPMLLIHGSADPMVPVAALHASAQALEALGFAVEAHVRPGLGHSVDAEGVTMGAAFARRVLNAAAAP